MATKSQTGTDSAGAGAQPASSAAGFGSHLLQVAFVKPVHVEGHTEYLLQVSMSGKAWQCMRRYREFDRLHSSLNRAKPTEVSLPELPPKKWFGNLRPSFVKQRQVKLQEYVDLLLQDPRFCSMPMLRDFFDTRRHMTQAPSSDPTAVRREGVSKEAAPVQSQVEPQVEERRRQCVVEEAERRMVEIYSAPPVVDDLYAAQQLSDIGSVFATKGTEIQRAVDAFEEQLQAALKQVSDSSADAVPTVSEQEKLRLITRSGALIVNFASA